MIHDTHIVGWLQLRTRRRIFFVRIAFLGVSLLCTCALVLVALGGLRITLIESQIVKVQTDFLKIIQEQQKQIDALLNLDKSANAVMNELVAADQAQTEAILGISQRVRHLCRETVGCPAITRPARSE